MRPLVTRSRIARVLLLLAPLLAVCSPPAVDQQGERGRSSEAEEPMLARAATLPEPPLALAAPLLPAGSGEAPDSPRSSPRSLFAGARSAAARKDFRSAVQLATGSVSRGGRGHLLLARAYARLGEVASSFYWLQRAALEEGVDPDAVADDDALGPLRDDSRWPEVARFLERSAAYWAGTERRALVIVAPDRPPRGALPLLVGLHGNGDEPRELLDDEAYRRRAQRLGVLFVGVSGAIPLGPKTYRWSIDPTVNARHVTQALADVRARLNAADDKVILFGFSEGAQAALETAGLDPERYRGAIALSPRSLGSPIAPIPPHPALARQRYVIALASFDSIDSVGTSYVDADRLRALGARVDLHTAWFYAAHALPPDFDVQLPHWVDALLGRP